MTAQDQEDKARRRRTLRARGMVRDSSGGYRERITKAHNERPIRLARERRLSARPARRRGPSGELRRRPFEARRKARKRPLVQRITRKLKSVFRSRGHQ